MHVRDALERDADTLASIADSPTEVMRNLVHDRTVRVAEDGTHDPNADVSEPRDDDDPDGVLGFVSFDARRDTVHVTQLDGTTTACKRLLAEPVRFAERESMAVELLVPTTDERVADAAGDLGFEELGSGPRFDGVPTVRFRLETAS